MTLLAPLAFLFALLALPILLLYMLKLRRKEVQVSSILLWERLLRDRQANAPWQRIKRSLLLLLQLLILAALVFALARPALFVPSPYAGSVVVILDASASMNAEDVEPNRFEAARAAVADLIRSLPSSARMTLILAGSQAETLIANASDPGDLRQALERAEVSQGNSDWQAAFALAASAASTSGAAGRGQELLGSPGRSQQSQPAIILVSDGGLPEAGLPGLPGQVRFLPVGESADNLAVSALALRPTPGGGELFARLTNYGPETRDVILSFYADGELFEAQELTLPGGESESITLQNLPAGKRTFTARLSRPGGVAEPLDILPLDDSAYAVAPAGGARRVLLATQGNVFLEQLLAALPGLEAYRILPREDGSLVLPEAGSDGEGFDLYIFDGLSPAELPEGSLLFVNPPENRLFEVRGYYTSTVPAQAADHELTRFVDWGDVNILRAREIVLPEWGESLVNAPGGPLVFAGEQGGRRAAALTFDLHESDLPLQVAFPILFSNLIHYLARDPGLGGLAAEENLRPGDSLQLPVPAEGGSLSITSPSGQVFTVEPGEAGASFNGAREPGIYRVQVQDDPQANNVFAANGFFAVNLFSPEESNLGPVEVVQIGNAAVPASRQAEVGQREIWPFIALAGLAVLMLEWWVYHRGATLRLRSSAPDSSR
jgi:hypothetical protein